MLTPTVGPIIGYTTTHHVRIFLRGKHENDLLVFGGIRYRLKNQGPWTHGNFALLKSSNDMSEVITLNNLSEDTEYEYQAGWFTTSSPLHTIETVKELPLEWPNETYSFRTASSKKTTPRCYVIGSCRYLRMTLGLPSAPELGDRIFAAIDTLAQNPSTPVHGLVMTGDQVYVDDLNFFLPDRDYKAILSKYRAAFSQPNIRKLMSHVPTYMILDDHEIEDNWPAKANRLDESLFRNAMNAYEIYQCSHSPAHTLLTSGQIDRTIKRYWYQFTDGDSEWFVLDTRTGRNLSAQDRRILDREQEQALYKWLINSRARVKLIVTGVMLYPDLKNDRGDAWKSFPTQRDRILETIRSNKIRNVVFISGDIHGSMTSQLTHSEDKDFLVHTIVSSPLCNSRLLPYAKAADFILDQPLTPQGSGSYRYALTSKVVSQDNFARITLDQQQITVDFHGQNGKLLQSVNIVLR
ncbi:alkaline phosphatase D family protein [Pseudomonas fluorescens]|uniref:PhoD-like phosphatase metallophosphatase domain-containing protein n=1 Tax=Pseudomonas fluorescens TaxID=294 RepID=A0A5E7B971_PSEFL|nr:alkaline phosphatase D family protein [Pseudomonas fluorescens]VVN85667.1 hypothetical protein PS723_01444 [Pseudomonas fluorescens]